MTPSTQRATAAPKPTVVTSPVSAKQVRYGSIKVDGLHIAFREAGDPNNPKLVLLHGFPSSSHQYRNLIEALADDFYVIAPDYQGFGNSDIPDPSSYKYTFDALAATTEKFLALQRPPSASLYTDDPDIGKCDSWGSEDGDRVRRRVTIKIAGKDERVTVWLCDDCK